jgi:glycosyltransferase involved in cell wall biosynthesis
MKEPIRIAFILDAGLLNWAGGFNYLRNLLAAVRDQDRATIEPVLFCGTNVDINRFKPLGDLAPEPIWLDSAFNSTRSMAGTLGTLLTGKNKRVEKLFLSRGVHVAFENATFLGARFGLPILAWIPDFQHRHLRRMFSPAAYLRRELGFRLQLRSTRTIMVSSSAARQDCMTLYEVPADRIVVVPFAVPASPNVVRPDPDEVRRHYRLPTRFFFLPNQFWKHKNHMTACRALAILQRRGESLCIAASGKLEDYRHPELYNEIVQYIEAESLTQSFRPLGEIPYPHLTALLRTSVAMINPSFFEGWSTTVEEAKAWGVPTIVSDLPVHREQLGSMGHYFDPASDTELAALLSHANQSWRPGPRLDDESLAALRAAHRVADFAAGFERAVKLCVQRRLDSTRPQHLAISN